MGTWAEIVGKLSELEADYSPLEAADKLESLVAQTFPSSEAYGLIQKAAREFRSAANMGDPEQLEESTKLMDSARATCREIVLTWLRDRPCPCCIALRSRIENAKQELDGGHAG